jgi:YfiH family protein
MNLGAHVGDSATAVAENRARLRARLPADPFWLHQEHGTQVVCAEESIHCAQADAAWSKRSHIVCTVMIADCLPVLLCDVDGTVVAAAHAGWRGLSAGIIENTVAAMRCRPEHILAWLGPAIGPNRFEVGDDVRSAFVRVNSSAASAFTKLAAEKWNADLCALARQRLGAMGVSQISGGGRCTYNEIDHFFSYRRDRVCGRMVAAIWLDSSGTA